MYIKIWSINIKSQLSKKKKEKKICVFFRSVADCDVRNSFCLCFCLTFSVSPPFLRHSFDFIHSRNWIRYCDECLTRNSVSWSHNRCSFVFVNSMNLTSFGKHMAICWISYRMSLRLDFVDWPFRLFCQSFFLAKNNERISLSDGKWLLCFVMFIVEQKHN